MNQYLYLTPSVLLNTIATKLDQLAADPAGIHAFARELRNAAAERDASLGAAIAQDARQFAADVKDEVKHLLHKDDAPVVDAPVVDAPVVDAPVVDAPKDPA